MMDLSAILQSVIIISIHKELTMSLGEMGTSSASVFLDRCHPIGTRLEKGYA